MNKQIFIQQIQLGNMANFSYIVGDKTSGKAAVIDPHDETDTIEAAAAKTNLSIGAVLLTHGHYDHTGGLKYYADKLKLPVTLSADEYFLYVPHCTTLSRVKDNDRIQLGSFTIECLHTPGHTPGCISFLFEGNLFTGDTLFVDAVGRTDLPGGDAATLFKSLQKIKQLPDATIIWPGHDYGSVASQTLKTLKLENPFLTCKTQKDFLSLAG